MDEIVINIADKIFMYPYEKPVVMKFHLFIGKLVLTNQRLLFLSTGTSGIGKMLSISLLWGIIPGLIFGRTSTKKLDLSALENEGSLVIKLKEIQSCEVIKGFDLSYLTFVTQNFIGEKQFFSCVTRYGLRRKWLCDFREDLINEKMKYHDGW